MIQDPHDPLLGDYTRLRDPEFRRSHEAAHGLFIAEGATVVSRLLDSGLRVRSVVVTQRGARVLARQLSVATAPVLEVSDGVAEAVTGFSVHRGVLACAERPRPDDAQRILAQPGPVLVLEGLTDQVNIGAIFRSAWALGAVGILLSPGCGDPLYRRSVRVSMGAAFLLPFAYLEDWPRGLSLVSESRLTIALTPDPVAEDLTNYGRPEEPFALVLGSEGVGLSPSALSRCRRWARIAIRPEADSLNVAAAAAIALHSLVGSRSP